MLSTGRHRCATAACELRERHRAVVMDVSPCARASGQTGGRRARSINIVHVYESEPDH